MLSNKSKRAWTTAILALAAILVLSVGAGCGQKNKTGGAAKEKVVATYNGGQITESEFNKELDLMVFLYPQYEQIVAMDEFKEFLLEQQVAYKVLSERAGSDAKAEGEKMAEEQIKAMHDQAGDEFKADLDKHKLTEQDVKNYMAKMFSIDADFRSKVSDEQTKAQFDKIEDDFTVASVRHILIGLTTSDNKERTKEEALKIAKDIEAKLKAGEDFAKLAKEYSDDPGSKDNGGLYENKEVSLWVPEFKKAAIELPLNQISEPIETSYGYHVLRVESRTEKTFDELTDDQKKNVKSMAAGEQINEFMQKELPKLNIKSNLPKKEEPKKEEPKKEESNQGQNKEGK
ncbi:peptidylprolyl isomerase [Paenibacillus sp. MSJ-34]|uniref:peptidylprolyl isomerase n=1 Tax=Paenibacillus sp. MSJ-34 TaxID=2841529 RepID=UPI001C10C745|nr:peptidylprolyl isomerase [Paenibacillus sp. MSJ-34]MBU5444132.1 peptidylprolyl isomerase [Paenibacillus sp. MSJ-34]